ncbi:MAG: sugar ABC transporter permease [bacterium]|nr:sugar ABC transporter permease [bacterium]
MRNRNPNYITPKERLESIILVVPVVVFIAAFLLFPVIGTIYDAFFRDVSYMLREFIFLGNYKRLFSDRFFVQSVFFTLAFVLASVSLELLIGMMFALLMNERFPARGLFRGIVLVPWAIPVAISGRIWELIYNFHYGLANYVLGRLGIGPVNWFGTSLSAFWALVLSDAWKTAPFVAIILLMGLQAIPEELYAQAKVDGTHFLQRFWKITLPLLKPFILVALLFRTIDALRVFDLIYVLTKGGPGGSTTSISLYAFRYFVSGDFGFGSAISTVLFLISLIMAIFYLKISRYGELLK